MVDFVVRGSRSVDAHVSLKCKRASIDAARAYICVARNARIQGDRQRARETLHFVSTLRRNAFSWDCKYRRSMKKIMKERKFYGKSI